MAKARWEDGWMVSELVGRDYLDVRGSVVGARGRHHAFAYAGGYRYLGDFGTRKAAKSAVEEAGR